MDQNNFDNLEFKRPRSRKKKDFDISKYGIPALIAVVIILVILLLSRCSEKEEITEEENPVKKGYITDGTETSDMIDSLFYATEEGEYFINVGKLDDAISADVIGVEMGYAIRTVKNQITILPGEDSYYINSNKITDDVNYSRPEIVDNQLFADTATIFEVFGYAVSYELNGEETIVKMTIRKVGNDNYDIIVPTVKKEPETIAPTEPQVEAQLLDPSLDLDKPEDGNLLPTVPRTDRKENYGEEENEEISEEGEEKEEEEESENENEDDENEEEEEETSSVIPRSTKMPNRKTDEEFEELWAEKKAAIAAIFQSATSLRSTTNYKERSDSWIAFNPMHHGIYYDTISVIEYDSVSEDNNVYIKATFSSDWSDQEMIAPLEPEKAYYRGIPATYEATIKILLGEEEGARFFAFLKENADKMTVGGYTYDYVDGYIIPVWHDDEVGDGIMASNINFEDWQYQTTDDGLRYCVSRELEDGFKIEILCD